jgi:predicted ATP-dependent endonuclease of OLD family
LGKTSVKHLANSTSTTFAIITFYNIPITPVAFGDLALPESSQNLIFYTFHSIQSTVMKLHCFRLKNFRRLKNTCIDLESDISIFVGSNNSGKTSATQGLHLFVSAAKDKLSIHDFSSDTWNSFNGIGEMGLLNGVEFPSITLDLWFHVEKEDISRVLELLPRLRWEGSNVGLRISFQPKDPIELLQKYRDLKAKMTTAPVLPESTYQPWPKNMFDYLQKELTSEYEFAYYSLDESQFNDKFEQAEGYNPNVLLPEKGKAILRSLLKVDLLNAQRHLSDVTSHARAEDLSKCLSRFYKRNLQQKEHDTLVLKALSDSEEQLNKHLAEVFQVTLGKLKNLGYPGVTNPILVIKSALNPTTIMNQDTRVHYSLDGSSSDTTLPDSYNGLGFKNLIYMVVEILDLQARWLEEQEDRALLHLIFIEEPEAHLHAQLQQVFVRKVLSLVEGSDEEQHQTQVVITTHSSHILYERGFKPIRYFKRSGSGGINQYSVCLNLSSFYNTTDPTERSFLEKYLKLTHCDLFFADAVILVEGNVERLLLPLMIEKVAPRLQTAYLTILEVGGAFAHKFRHLIEFLDITCLIITDIDSIHPSIASTNEGETDPTTLVPLTAGVDGASETEDESEEDDDNVSGRACLVGTDGAHSSNYALRTWLPGKSTVEELLSATDHERTQEPTAPNEAKIYVAYQNKQPIIYNAETKKIAGRTLEESFALENAEWCQDIQQKQVGLRVRPKPATIDELATKLFTKVSGKSFDKTKFALEILTVDQTLWKVPNYIETGLVWLQNEITEEELVTSDILVEVIEAATTETTNGEVTL